MIADLLGPFRATALAAVEKLINQALAYDPASRQAIARLQGKVVAIESTFPPLAFFVLYEPGGIRLRHSVAETPNTRLKGSAAALAALAVNGQQQASLYNSGVEISGDQALLQQVREILGNLDIDWEAALARLLGDVPAHLVADSLRKAGQWGKTNLGRTTTNLSEFSIEEIRLLPSRVEANAFSDGIKRLRQDVDRIAARISKLKRQLADSGNQ